MNTVNLVGRIGNDPEVNEAGTVIKFSLATNDGYGENKKTNWHNCVAFGKSIEIIKNYVKKGDQLAVQGQLDYNKGEKGYFTSIIVRDFTFINNKKDGPNEPSDADLNKGIANPVGANKGEENGDLLPY